ncbi:WD40 repeat domain-containing protein [Streptomyces sp. NPDC002742]|uniref:WD40 repeat domain-containing protein n=1 Tax=Streptomyces sp. NPDC002742 TaxID=3364663 RepID=UPI0036ABE409
MTGWQAVVNRRAQVPGCLHAVPAPGGRAVAVVTGNTVAVHDPLSSVLWEQPSPGGASGTVDAIWAPDGETVYVLAGGRALARDAHTGAERPLPPDLRRAVRVTAMALSGDGRTLAVGDDALGVWLFHPDVGGSRQLEGVGRSVTALAWRPGTEELCVARSQGLQFWDVGLSALVRSDTAVPLGVAWSAEGALLAVAGPAEVTLIDMADHRQRVRLPVRDRPIRTAFGRNGSTLLVGTEDGAVVVYDRYLQRIAALGTDGPGTLFTSLAVSADGTLATCDRAGEIVQWRLPDTAEAPPDDDMSGRQAVQGWAVRMAHTVGRVPVSPAAVPEVGTQLLSDTAEGRRTAVLAWQPGGGSYFVQDTRGLTRVDAVGGRTVWSTPVAVRGGLYDLEAGPAGSGLLAAATHQKTGVVRLHADADGALLAEYQGGQGLAWSPTAPPTLVFPETGPRPRRLLVLRDPRRDARGGPQDPLRVLSVEEGVGRPVWSPDGSWLAAPTEGRIVFWETATWQRAPGPGTGDRGLFAKLLAWSPDPEGRHLAVVPSKDGEPVTIYDTRTWTARRTLGPYGGYRWGPGLAWSPDGRLLAYPLHGEPGVVRLWDVTSGLELRDLRPSGRPAGGVWSVRWAPEGAAVTVGHVDGPVIRWSLPGAHAPARGTTAGPVLHGPPEQAETLLALGAAGGAAGLSVPLSTLHTLHSLIADRAPRDRAGQERARALDGQGGLAALRALHWSRAACTGIAVSLAAELPPDDRYAPVENAAAEEYTAALRAALAGAPAEANAPTVPIGRLRSVFGTVDDALLTLLAVLGPDAVALDPTLPVRLRGVRHGLVPLPPRQRRLLGVRIPLWPDGQAQGSAPSTTLAGFTRHGRLTQLPATQLALPPDLLAFRLAHSGALFRARQGALPPSPTATVIVLDTGPAVYGAVGVTLRLVAHLLASALTDGGLPCAFVTLGEVPTVRPLSRRGDLVHVWTEVSVGPGRTDAALQLATTTARTMGSMEDAAVQTVVLTHPFRAVPGRGGLRTVRVRYPGGRGRHLPADFVLETPPTAESLRTVVSGLLAEHRGARAR